MFFFLLYDNLWRQLRVLVTDCGLRPASAAERQLFVTAALVPLACYDPVMFCVSVLLVPCTAAQRLRSIMVTTMCYMYIKSTLGLESLRAAMSGFIEYEQVL